MTTPRLRVNMSKHRRRLDVVSEIFALLPSKRTRVMRLANMNHATASKFFAALEASRIVYFDGTGTCRLTVDGRSLWDELKAVREAVSREADAVRAVNERVRAVEDRMFLSRKNRATEKMKVTKVE